MSAFLVRITEDWLYDPLLPSSRKAQFRRVLAKFDAVTHDGFGNQPLSIGLPFNPVWFHLCAAGSHAADDSKPLFQSIVKVLQQWPVVCSCSFLMSLEELLLMTCGACPSCGAEVFALAEIHGMDTILALGDCRAWIAHVLERLPVKG